METNRLACAPFPGARFRKIALSMTSARKPVPAATRNRDPVRDSLVVLCMTVVALALGIGLHLQFALALWLAVIAALSVYVALLSTHILVRRSEHVDQLQRELARLENQVGRQPVKRVPAPLVVAPVKPPADMPDPVAPVAETRTTSSSAEPELASTDLRTESSAASIAGFDDYWNFSPKNTTTAQAGNSAVGEQAATGPQLAGLGSIDRLVAEAPAMLQPSRQREADFDQINAVIKKLAADITQGQAAMAKSANTELARNLPHTVEVDASVAALHAAADVMRHAGTVSELGSHDADIMDVPIRGRPRAAISSSPPPVPQRRLRDPARDRLAAIAEALENERLDVMLEPILALGDRRAQHYVVSVRLWGDDKDLAAEADMGRVARGSGLLPLLDAVKVERAARVAWRMEDRGKPGSLFSTLSGESLVSDRFLNRFADTYRQGDTLGSRLVLSFTQGDLRVFSDLQWSTLKDMADLGFRFSLEDITDLDFDFDALATSGFAFVKLDAGVFLNGLPAAVGVIPAEDVCQYVAGRGLALIVGGITDDAVAIRLKSYGVELAQGPLFGQPRPVKADVLRNPHAAVA